MAMGALWNSVKSYSKGFGRALKANSKASNYINRAVKWGAIGGAVGGVSEWAQGGSFFEGAKSGALTGAVAGAGYTAFKAGRGGIHSKKYAGARGTIDNLGKARPVSWRRPGAGAGAAEGAATQAAASAAAAGGAGQAGAARAATQAADTSWMGAGRARVQAKLDRYGQVQAARGAGLENMASNWSAAAEADRLGLPMRNTMHRPGRRSAAVSKQVTALNQLYGDVAAARRANGLA